MATKRTGAAAPRESPQYSFTFNFGGWQIVDVQADGFLEAINIVEKRVPGASLACHSIAKVPLRKTLDELAAEERR